jgi:dihydrofolate reductase
VSAAPGAHFPLVIVAAVADNGVIGCDGGMPWRLKSDLAHFRAVTTGHPVVMGRRTFLSLARRLKDRTTIVLTRDPSFAAGGIVVAPTLAAAIDVAQGDALRRGAGAIMIVGGAALYADTIACAARLEITRVHTRPQGDTVFPPIDLGEWHETARREHAAGPGDDAAFTVVTYERDRKAP